MMHKLGTEFFQDNIATDKALGMGTTGGALALTDSEPDGAPIVDKVSQPLRESLNLLIYLCSAAGGWCYYIW